MGSATIVDVHFHAARLYSGLEVLTLDLELSGAELGVEGPATSDDVGLGAEYCRGGAKRPDSAGALCFLVADTEVMTGSGVLAFVGGMAVFANGFGGAGAGVDFATAGALAAPRGFGSAAALDVVFTFTAFAFAASVFFACVVVLASFSAAAAVAVALVGDFLVLMGPLALETLVVGTAAAVSFKVSFIAWAFFGRVVETCRTQ